MTTGLGIALAGLFLGLGLLAAAWVVVRTLTGQRLSPLAPAAAAPDAPSDFEHVGGVDLDVLTDAERDEVLWVEETLARPGAPQADLLEAHRLLAMYQARTKERREQS